METPISLPDQVDHVITLPNHRLDGEARALYWGTYRERYNQVRDVLTPGQLITPDSDIVVAMIGNSTLNWNSLDLKSQDRIPLAGVSYPGKSAHIDFTDSLNPDIDLSTINLDMLCDAILNRKQARRTDHLYAATVAEIEAAHYKVYYTPQPNHPLHLRLVHATQAVDDPPHDIKHTEKQALLEVFKKIK